MFILTIGEPSSLKRNVFARTQEEMQKDFERAFGILRTKLEIIANPFQFMNVSTMDYIIRFV